MFHTVTDCDFIVTGHIVTVLLLAMLLVIVIPLLLATLLFAVPTQTYRAGGTRVESEDGAKV